MSTLIKRLRQFIKHDIWQINPREYPRVKSFVILQLRILLIAFRGFVEGKMQLRASALTYYSMLSVVPVVAMIFGIAKGFGFQKWMEDELRKNFTGQEEVIDKIIEFANSLLQNTRGGIIAGIGLIILFWTVMKLLGNIEYALNDIWRIKTGRSILRKLTDYFSIMLIAPIFFLFSSSLTVFISTQLTGITEAYTWLGYIGPVLEFFMKLIPYAIIWLLFTFIYMVMPNTNVNFKSALVGGIIAGTFFQLVQWGYVHSQVAMSRYNTIYGSFAALPLFLIWLQISWLIVLFGSELSFANQNVEKYEKEQGSLNISHYYRQILTLLTTNLIVKNFMKGNPPLTAEDIAHSLELPIRIVREMIYDLVEIRVFSEIVTDNKERAYQPAYDIHSMKISSIIERLEKQGKDDISVKNSDEYQKIDTIMNHFREKLKSSPENVLVQDI